MKIQFASDLHLEFYDEHLGFDNAKIIEVWS